MILSLVLTFYAVSVGEPAEDSVFFDMPDVVETKSGYIRLVWSGNVDDADYLLEQSQNPNFRQGEVIYQGPDKATFVSGLSDGDYYFRVKMNDGEWAGPVQVQVRHHSLQLALTLAGIGLAVFLSIVFVIIKGNLTQREL